MKQEEKKQTDRQSFVIIIPSNATNAAGEQKLNLQPGKFDNSNTTQMRMEMEMENAQQTTTSRKFGAFVAAGRLQPICIIIIIIIEFVLCQTRIIIIITSNIDDQQQQ